MLWIIALIFVLLWVLGLVTSYTLGGYLHALLVVAVVLLLVQIIKGPRTKIPGKSRHYRRRIR